MNRSVTTRIIVALTTALMISGCCNEKSIPFNIKKLSSSATREQTEAAFALARCGSEADAAVLQLSNLLFHENKGVQSAAAYALRKIDTPSARKALPQR